MSSCSQGPRLHPFTASLRQQVTIFSCVAARLCLVAPIVDEGNRTVAFRTPDIAKHGISSSFFVFSTTNGLELPFSIGRPLRLTLKTVLRLELGAGFA